MTISEALSTVIARLQRLMLLLGEAARAEAEDERAHDLVFQPSVARAKSRQPSAPEHAAPIDPRSVR